MPETKFVCDRCQRSITYVSEVTTGYASVTQTWITGKFYEAAKICFDCCADWDRARMEAGEDMTLYLHRSDQAGTWVGNWPGTLRIAVSQVKVQKTTYTPTGGRVHRRDVWFMDHKGYEWHGINKGDMDIVRCKRLKLKKAR